MGSFFSNRTIYQIVAIFEFLFSILILSFSIKVLFVLSHDEALQVPTGGGGGIKNGTGTVGDGIVSTSTSTAAAANKTESYSVGVEQLKSSFQYSAIVGVVQSPVQILFAFLLLLKSKVGVDDSGEEVRPEPVPTFWILQTVVQISALLFMFIYPLKVLNSHDIPSDWHAFRSSVQEFDTYILTNLLFKFFFIWAISTTIKSHRYSRKRMTFQNFEVEEDPNPQKA